MQQQSWGSGRFTTSSSNSGSLTDTRTGTSYNADGIGIGGDIIGALIFLPFCILSELNQASREKHQKIAAKQLKASQNFGLEFDPNVERYHGLPQSAIPASKLNGFPKGYYRISNRHPHVRLWWTGKRFGREVPFSPISQYWNGEAWVKGRGGLPKDFCFPPDVMPEPIELMTYTPLNQPAGYYRPEPFLFPRFYLYWNGSQWIAEDFKILRNNGFMFVVKLDGEWIANTEGEEYWYPIEFVEKENGDRTIQIKP